MKKVVRGALIGVLALAVGVGIGVPANAAATPTLTLSGGSGVFGLGTISITGTASVPGTIKFMANGVVIAGCEAVATNKDAAPYVAKCALWVPTAAGAASLTGTLTPTDTVGYTSADSPKLNVMVGTPVQTTTNNPIQIYVDTILATGSTGAIAPRFNGCAIMNEFLLGQTIVFRVYANNADQGNAVMDSSNTKEAYVEVAGLKNRLPMSYGNHSGVAFWTAVLKTGPGTDYNTLGEIVYKVVMTAKDSSTMKVLSTKLVARVENGQRVKDAYGNTIYDRVSYYRTVTVTPVLKGATGVFQSNFAATSRLTLYAVPASK